MAGRHLSAEEERLWRRVVASVRPIGARAPARPLETARPVVRLPSEHVAETPRRSKAAAPTPGNTLDGGWDRRLSRGLVSPDRTVDLHGHGLQSAYSVLDHSLDQAISDGVRVLLLVTGKAPPRESERPHARGAIRAAVGDWLAASRHADRIAAVRTAHPRHGGQGALYIILRRSRPVS